MNPADVLLKVVEVAERVQRVVRVLGPVYEAVDRYLHEGGPEPSVFQQLPELRSPAELERARVIARQNAQR